MVFKLRSRSIHLSISQTPRNMRHNNTCRFTLLFFILFNLLLSLSPYVEAYKNYTVGDSLGWYDKLEKPTVNYQKWVAGKKFGLGDFLFFNTDTNHSVIQTYNFTTYNQCDYDDALDTDTTSWSAGDPSSTSPQPVTVAVPLLKIGMTYFFSSDYDGEQCENGQKLKINVTYGQGLPKSLIDPADEAPSPANPDAGGDEALPENLVPSNLKKPKEESDADSSDDERAGIRSKASLKIFGWQLNGGLILLGLICTF